MNLWSCLPLSPLACMVEVCGNRMEANNRQKSREDQYDTRLSMQMSLYASMLQEKCKIRYHYFSVVARSEGSEGWIKACEGLRALYYNSPATKEAGMIKKYRRTHTPLSTHTSAHCLSEPGNHI
jgi:hypothetical protein